ncbi:MAG: DUF917 domain-containing protein [Candidatus Heimdallarchaeota archaeon]|nr:DUF917 domain-containing protein [Candidatus Heimdallarchaeota archaeon]
MTVRKLSKQDAYDLVIGAKILACGGGGSEVKALENINKIYDLGMNFTIADLTDFQPDDSLCIIGMVGGGITEEDKKLVEGKEIVENNPMVTAVKELEMFLDKEFSALVATELGPNNSIIPLMVAAQMGKVAVNGDCCGRSKPKISISTTRVKDIPIAPFSIVNHYGDTQIVKNVTDDLRGELFARTSSRLSGGSVGVARCPMKIKEAQQAVIPLTLSLAMELGKQVRIANEQKKQPMKTIFDTLPDTRIVFTGKVRDFSRTEEGGFTSGEIILDSMDITNHELKVWYQNEYLLSWLNGKSFVTCPDGMYIVDSKTGYGLTPWEDDFKKGREVTVFTRDAPEVWQSEKGLQVFGPRTFKKDWSKYKKASTFKI